MEGSHIRLDVDREFSPKPEASRFFGQMMAHWDTPTAVGPKTKENHEAEAAEFAKLLK